MAVRFDSTARAATPSLTSNLVIRDHRVTHCGVTVVTNLALHTGLHERDLSTGRQILLFPHKGHFTPRLPTR